VGKPHRQFELRFCGSAHAGEANLPCVYVFFSHLRCSIQRHSAIVAVVGCASAVSTIETATQIVDSHISTPDHFLDWGAEHDKERVHGAGKTGGEHGEHQPHVHRFQLEGSPTRIGSRATCSHE
jgi:hypothetical protein